MNTIINKANYTIERDNQEVSHHQNFEDALKLAKVHDLIYNNRFPLGKNGYIWEVVWTQTTASKMALQIVP